MVRLGVLAAAAMAGLVTTASITITPANHDFGEYAVNAVAYSPTEFTITVSGNVPPGTTLTGGLTGPDASDFGLANGATIRQANCSREAQGYRCTTFVQFQPHSLGVKQARLEVSDGHGGQGVAQLKGTGIGPLCLHRVVPCNYALHWSGTFGWTSTLNSEGSQYRETVQVNVINGSASCTGSATQSGNGRSLTGPIVGTGLFAVEFLHDPVYPWVYLITAACPSPHWPATDGYPATPSQPAELGHNEYTSEKQPAASRRMDPQQLLRELPRLQGSITYPSPDTDPLNGVTGSVTVSWNLTRS